jgi:hypothetical protein
MTSSRLEPATFRLVALVPEPTTLPRTVARIYREEWCKQNGRKKKAEEKREWDLSTKGGREMEEWIKESVKKKKEKRNGR